MTERDFYFAPMEGITLYTFRKVHHRFFPGIRKYYTPFLVANQTLTFKKRELREILPENNGEIPVVPQILTNKADQLLWAVDTLCEYGYQEVNLNLGCPFPTVVSRGKGAGFLKEPEALELFFDRFFEGLSGKRSIPRISVKTRIGVEDTGEAERLLSIYRKYPFSELIVHPRLQKEMYRGNPHWDIFEEFLKAEKDGTGRLCGNGDIRTVKDYAELQEMFPQCGRWMLGRGLVRDPSLVNQLQGGSPAGRQTIFSYQEALYEEYQETIFGEQNVVNKMKEIWSYMGDLFPKGEKALKKLRKARTKEQYQEAMSRLFETEYLFE